MAVLVSVSLIVADLLLRIGGHAVDLLPLFIVVAAATGLLFGLAVGAGVGALGALYALGRILLVPTVLDHLILAGAAILAGVGGGLLSTRLRGEAPEHRRSPAERGALQLLSDTCDILGGSLELEESAARFLDRLMPEWADWGALDITTPRGEIRRLAAGHRDEARRGILEELERYPPELLSDAPIARVLRSGKPVVMNTIDSAVLDRFAVDDRHRELLELLQPGSAIVLPLVARKRMVGALTLAMAESGRRYEEEDLPITMQLADRMAMAIDNVHLFNEAVDANQAKADFLAVMSHELRTPLSAVLGYADILEAEIAGPITDDQRTQIERIRASAWHLADLVDEVLTYARAEAGRGHIETAEVDVVDLVHGVVDIARGAEETREVEIVAGSISDEIRIHTDRAKLRQVVVNLVNNAVKFTHEGRVEVTVSENPNTGTVTISVSDTGQGISPGHLDRIFEPFWQADQGPTRRVGGTGLGLAVAKRLTAILQGDLSAESTLGKGSTFRLVLPRARPDAVRRGRWRGAPVHSPSQRDHGR